MKSILEELANENISLNGGTLRYGPEYKNLLKKLIKKEDQLNKQLNEQQKILKEEIYEIETKMNYITENNMFKSGYRLGALMMIEVFTTMDDD